MSSLDYTTTDSIPSPDDIIKALNAYFYKRGPELYSKLTDNLIKSLGNKKLTKGWNGADLTDIRARDSKKNLIGKKGSVNEYRKQIENKTRSKFNDFVVALVYSLYTSVYKVSLGKGEDLPEHLSQWVSLVPHIRDMRLYFKKMETKSGRTRNVNTGTKKKPRITVVDRKPTLHIDIRDIKHIFEDEVVQRAIYKNMQSPLRGLLQYAIKRVGSLSHQVTTRSVHKKNNKEVQVPVTERDQLQSKINEMFNASKLSGDSHKKYQINYLGMFLDTLFKGVGKSEQRPEPKVRGPRVKAPKPRVESPNNTTVMEDDLEDHPVRTARRRRRRG